MEEIDLKIADTLKKLNEASQSYQEKFIRPVTEHREIAAQDFFELALAQDTINLLETQYKLLLAKKFPERSTPKTIEYLENEEAKYKENVECWKNREFPKHSDTQ